MTTVAGYIRVSTEEQAGEGISLAAQRAKIEAYCALNDLELIETIADEGISAKNLKRPGLQNVLEMARRREIGGIVILKLDRMFRNTVDALQTSDELDKRGVSLHSISEKLDTRSAVGRFYFSLLASLAEMERGITAERTRDALQHKKTRNERIGNIPYGCRLGGDGVHLVENPAEQKVLCRISALRDSGLSLNGVADALNNEGLRTRGGGEWQKQNIHNLIKKAN